MYVNKPEKRPLVRRDCRLTKYCCHFDPAFKSSISHSMRPARKKNRKPYKPVKPSIPAVAPDNAAIDVLQYSITAKLLRTAASLYATISPVPRSTLVRTLPDILKSQTPKTPI